MSMGAGGFLEEKKMVRTSLCNKKKFQDGSQEEEKSQDPAC